MLLLYEVGITISEGTYLITRLACIEVQFPLLKAWVNHLEWLVGEIVLSAYNVVNIKKLLKDGHVLFKPWMHEALLSSWSVFGVLLNHLEEQIFALGRCPLHILWHMLSITLSILH